MEAKSAGRKATLSQTDFKFDNQRSLYHGKVRDVYDIDDRLMVMVATDRISAFDVVLPEGIPFYVVVQEARVILT